MYAIYLLVVAMMQHNGSKKTTQLKHLISNMLIRTHAGLLFGIILQQILVNPVIDIRYVGNRFF
jgi:hypothetical protein